MKALHLLKTSVGARWALMQLRELVRLGIEMPRGACQTKPALSRSIAAPACNVHVLDLNAIPATPAWFRAAGALRRLVDAETPDVVHSHFVATTLLMRAALGGTSTPRVFQVPGPLHLESRLFSALTWPPPAVTTSGSRPASGRARQRLDAVDRPRGALTRATLSFVATAASAGRRRGAPACGRSLDWRPGRGSSGWWLTATAPRSIWATAVASRAIEDFIDAIGCLRAEGRDVVGVVAGGAWQGARQLFRSVQDYAAGHAHAHIVFLGTRRDISADSTPTLPWCIRRSRKEPGRGRVELLGRPTVTTGVGGFPDSLSRV